MRPAPGAPRAWSGASSCASPAARPRGGPTRAAVARLVRRGIGLARRGRLTLALAVACAIGPAIVPGLASAVRADVPAATLFRVFLKDGTPLVSYGECTRDGDRVVFAVPLGQAASPDSLQVVSLPASAVDWERTLRYTETVRFRRYAATRGEADYDALNAEVARALTELALSADPARKLAVARQVRALLADWPRTHYGYRARDVRELAAIVDEAISQAQADLGERAFTIDLVAEIEAPPGDLLADPTLEETVLSARAAALASETPAERLSLLQAIRRVLGAPDRAGAPPARWVAHVRRTVERDITAEERVARLYASLASDARRAAARHVADGNVTGVERVIADVRARDAKLGQRRPDETAALLAHLRSEADAAAARRLELDRWAYRLQAHGGYRDRLDDVLRRLGRLSGELDAIRTMAGPEPARLDRLRLRVADARVRLLPLDAPADLRAVQDTAESAVALMDEAVRLRQDAVIAADPQRARNASSAAAGALLLLDRARAALAAYFARPGRS